MSPRSRTILFVAIVFFLFGFAVYFKTSKIFANPTWNAQSEVGQFWSEFAFQYRFARFFATHPVRDWGELSQDTAVQYPDPVDDWAEFTVAMEVPAGLLYRFGTSLAMPLPPFHVFIVWYDCIVSSLSIFGVFFLARALWQNDGAGLLAAIFWVTLYPSYGRTVRNLFLREDFAVPLILFALLFTVRALQEDGMRDQVLAAVFWLLALASWHLTQFVMVVLMAAVVLVYLGKGKTPRRSWLVMVMTVGAFVVPVLRAKQFWLSPTMCLLYALSLAVWINGGRRRAIKVFAVFLGMFLVLGALLQKSYGEYAHVYALFFYKLRFLGIKPENPAALPWEARLLWEGPFNTADLGQFWRSLGLCLPLSLLALGLVPRSGGISVKVFVVFTLLLFPLAWMVIRYFTFLGFAVAVLAAGVLAQDRVGWKLLAVAAAIVQLAMLDFKPLKRVQPNPAEYAPIVSWLNVHTPTNAVILATISESPVFLAETGRPIILHSKFENQRIRDRYREFLESIYGSEEQFFQFAKKYGADYFVYDTGFLIAETDSRRYKADRMGPLDPNCAARLFQEHPERLTHFQQQDYGIFRVLR